MEVEFKNLQKNFSVIFSGLTVKFGQNLNKLSSVKFVLGPRNDDLLQPYFWAQGTNHTSNQRFPLKTTYIVYYHYTLSLVTFLLVIKYKDNETMILKPKSTT